MRTSGRIVMVLVCVVLTQAIVPPLVQALIDNTPAVENAVLVRARQGSLDMNFGSSGTTDSFGTVQAVAVQKDGKIVTAGSLSPQIPGTLDQPFYMAIARYLPSGAPDATFGGGDGRVLVNFDPNPNIPGLNAFANALAIQSDGRIVVAGNAHTPESHGSDIAVIRLLRDGSLDPSFGDGDGKTTAGWGLGWEEGRDMAVQPDGRIVVIADRDEFSNEFAAVRFTFDGSLDVSFGESGMVTTFLTETGAVSPTAVALQADGKIVGVGRTPVGFGVVRYTKTGSADTSFDGDGIVTTSVPGGLFINARDVAVQVDGKIVVAGAALFGESFEMVVARYQVNGAPDTSFGSGDGQLTTSFGTGNSVSAFAVALQADSKIVAAGGGRDATSGFLVALARYLPSGELDNGFGTGGKALTSYGDNTDARAMAILKSNGRIVTAGVGRVSRYHAFTCQGYAVTRLGTVNTDTLTGTSRDDVIRGLGGGDSISGRGGNDVLCGGNGDDSLDGGDGNDSLSGDNGNDNLLGGNGTDVCNGGPHTNLGVDQASGCETITAIP